MRASMRNINGINAINGKGKSLRHGLALALLAAVLAGCAGQGGADGVQKGESKGTAASEEVAVSAVRLVIFREGAGTARADKPVNVYIDERYQASLIGNAYSEHVLCPGEHLFAVAFEAAGSPYDARQNGTALELSRDALQYLRIVEDDGGKAGYARATEEEAGAALKTLGYAPAEADTGTPSVNCAVP